MTDTGSLGNFWGIYKMYLRTGCLERKGKEFIIVSSSLFQGWPYKINCWVTSKLHQSECGIFLTISTCQHQTSPKALSALGGVLPNFVCKVWVKPIPLSVAGANGKAKRVWSAARKMFDTSTYSTPNVFIKQKDSL